MPMFWAAALDRSRTRPRMNGPRSLMRTTTLRPLLRLVTFTLVPNRSERWAAVRSLAFMRSPEAVFEPSAYHEAPPHPAAWASATNADEQAKTAAAVTTERQNLF